MLAELDSLAKYLWWLSFHNKKLQNLVQMTYTLVGCISSISFHNTSYDWSGFKGLKSDWALQWTEKVKWLQ